MQLDMILHVVPEMFRSSLCSSSLAAENIVMVMPLGAETWHLPGN